MANYENITTCELEQEYDALQNELMEDISDSRLHEIEARMDEIQDILDSRDPLAED